MRSILFFIVLAVIFSGPVVFAQQSTNYTLLAPIDHIQGAVDSGSFGTYIESMIKLVMALSVVLAVVMLVIGGFKYMTGEAIQMKGEGVKNMQQALIGLAIVFVSFLILQTINPNLLNLDLIVSKVEDARTGFAPPATQPPSPAPGTQNPPLPVGDHTVNAVALAREGFGVVSTNRCNDRNRIGCTSLDGLRPETMDGIVQLKSGCSACAQLVITGGTEVGHETDGVTTHQNGYKVDISTSQRNGAQFGQYLQQELGLSQVQANTNYTLNKNGYRYTIRYENNHWDIKVER